MLSRTLCHIEGIWFVLWLRTCIQKSWFFTVKVVEMPWKKYVDVSTKPSSLCSPPIFCTSWKFSPNESIMYQKIFALKDIPSLVIFCMSFIATVHPKPVQWSDYRVHHWYYHHPIYTPSAWYEIIISHNDYSLFIISSIFHTKTIVKWLLSPIRHHSCMEVDKGG